MDEGFCVRVNYEFIKDNDRNCQERKIRIFHSFLIRSRFYGYISEPELYKYFKLRTILCISFFIEGI